MAVREAALPRERSGGRVGLIQRAATRRPPGAVDIMAIGCMRTRGGPSILAPRGPPVDIENMMLAGRGRCEAQVLRVDATQLTQP